MMRTLSRLLLAAALAGAAANAATPPARPKPVDDRRMSTVYLFAHAAAILEACMASADAPSFPEAKSREIGDLSARLASLVRSIGTHYRDAELVGVYESTKAHMAADTKLRFHVKNNHQNCGERTLGEMRAYVAENEALIGRFLEQKRANAPASPPKR